MRRDAFLGGLLGGMAWSLVRWVLKGGPVAVFIVVVMLVGLWQMAPPVVRVLVVATLLALPCLWIGGKVQRCQQRQAWSLEDDPISREAVYVRDNGCCYICGKRVPMNAWHLEHTIPQNSGGPDAYWNVGVSCPPCNLSKGKCDPRDDRRWRHLLNAIPDRERRQWIVDEYLARASA